MKNVLYLLFTCFLVLSTSCNVDEDPTVIPCGVQNPAEDLDWMKELVIELESTEMGREYSYIKSGYYEGNFYYYLGSCCPNCNWASVTYNCQGEVQEDLEFEMNDMTDVQLVWRSESNMCAFEE